jgi:hypothetical protein
MSDFEQNINYAFEGRLAVAAVTMKAKLHFLEQDDVPSILNPASPTPHIAGTKIIATIGPACHEVDQLVELLECGMSCARIDLTVSEPPA